MTTGIGASNYPREVTMNKLKQILKGIIKLIKEMNRAYLREWHETK